jgi:hypothetical protein
MTKLPKGKNVASGTERESNESRSRRQTLIKANSLLNPHRRFSATPPTALPTEAGPFSTKGTYIVSSIWCEAAGGRRLKGPFAEFVVHKGQVLNLGRLVIEYTPPPFELHLLPHIVPAFGEWKISVRKL